MTVTISLAPEEQKKLAERAAAAGRGVSEYVQALIKRDLAVPPSIVDAAEPVANAVAASGISDEEFDAFVEQSRQEVWEERRARQAKPS